eukprot:NODE_339_length_1652_cov_634.402004.p1 GENE.NODE_339_length_1652_cov_634.402004~~NODE_339_length_1652_cov_634.402004.p1  ORF type:complete len:459 (-),score=123.60 NODE_339_length_1652_cov_634.402004:258-1634(-)
MGACRTRDTRAMPYLKKACWDKLEAFNEAHDDCIDEEVDESMRLCCEAAKGDIQALQNLLEHRANINAKNDDGRTALHVAASHGQVAALHYLVQMKANLNVYDEFHLTPLADAFRHNEDRAIEALHAWGSKCSDRTILADESQRKHWTIASQDVKLDTVLATTQKSEVWTATWRDTKVIAKKIHMCDGVGAHDSIKWEEEMLREINILALLRHPDLVLFLGACIDASPCFFISEFMEGGDLESHYVNEVRKLAGRAYQPPLETFVKWGSAVARALAFLHDGVRPILHRDLKPMNLLLTAEKEVKLADFGTSKITMPKTFEYLNQRTTAPMMTGFIGTQRYMAPEVVRSETYTEKCDIYSFALCLYFMAAGASPFADIFGENAQVIVSEHRKGSRIRPTLNEDIAHPQVQKLMQEMWHETPSERLSAIEVTHALKELEALAVSCKSPRKRFRALSGSSK